MAINTNTPRTELTATSGQVNFEFNFKVFTSADIVAYLTPSGQTSNDTNDLLTLSTDYTVSINGDDGGTLTLLSGASTGDKITITRQLSVTRTVEYQQGGDILAETSNNDQEYQTYLIQDLEGSKSRFMELPSSAQGLSNKLPSPEANQYIRWNNGGTALINDATIPPSVQLAVDSAAAAAISESNAASSASSSAASASTATNAASSALSSASTATSAASTATNAANTATTQAGITASHLAAIESIYDNFDDRYLGAKASDPTLDNDGNALQIGAIYFNTTLNDTKFYNGSTWENPELTSTQAASTATTKASEASISASNAATSETNAATSEANALIYRNEAEVFRNEASAFADGVTYETLDINGDIGFGAGQVPQGSDVIDYVNANKTISKTASNVLLNQSSLSLDDYAVTKNFAVVTYTGNGTSQDIVTGISSVDFTVSGNGSGYWHDRTAGDCIVKNDAGTVIESGSCVVNVSKVHIKSRSSANSNHIWDGLRGDNAIYTDLTLAEVSNTFIDYNSNGITINTSASSVNGSGSTYVAYQALYTHIRWGLTNQNKRFIEAYNPITGDTMIMYEMSNVAGNELPVSVGELDFITIKDLDASTNWIAQGGTMSDTEALYLNLTNAIGSI